MNQKSPMPPAICDKTSPKIPPKIPWRNLAQCSTHSARIRVPFEHAARLSLLPLGLHEHKKRKILTVAQLCEQNSDNILELKFIAECEIKCVRVDCIDPARAIYAAYHGDGAAIQRAASRSAGAASKNNQPITFNLAGRSAETEIFDALLAYGLSRGASDLHFIPSSTGAEVKLRIDGELYGHGDALYSKSTHQKIISRIKVLSCLDLTCKHLPQDGRFRIPIGRDEVDIRVSFLPTVHGEKSVLRILGEKELKSLHNIGLPSKAHSMLKSALENREGIILFAGPTGSGKSTTMYASIAELRDQNLSVVTVEDPVEINLDGISQTSINEERGLTYPISLRSVLRQDPDVILIGEMRDKESAQIGLQASQTGHLLLSTVHAGNLDEIFDRLNLLEIVPANVLPSLRAAFVQRLVPRVCAACSESAEQLCPECGGTRRSGRVLLVEALTFPPGALALIKEETHQIASLLASLCPQNYLSLAESANEAYMAGQISIDDLERIEKYSAR